MFARVILLCGVFSFFPHTLYPELPKETKSRSVRRKKWKRVISIILLLLFLCGGAVIAYRIGSHARVSAKRNDDTDASVGGVGERSHVIPATSDLFATSAANGQPPEEQGILSRVWQYSASWMRGHSGDLLSYAACSAGAYALLRRSSPSPVVIEHEQVSHTSGPSLFICLAMLLTGGVMGGLYALWRGRETSVSDVHSCPSAHTYHNPYSSLAKFHLNKHL